MVSGIIVRRFSLLSRTRVLPKRGDFAEGPGNVSNCDRYDRLIALIGVLYMETASLQNMPFQTKNKVRLFFVLVGGASFAFAIPFAGTLYQLKKKST